MKNNASAIATLVIALVAAGAAGAAIVSITTGTAVRGDRAANLLANGSFEQRAIGDPGAAIAVYWSGVNGLHTESTLQAQVYAIPGWGQTSGAGAYGIWGDSALIKTDPCAHGVACLYFGNWVTQASPFPTFNSDGTATFALAPSFTNLDPDNQAPTTLYQTVGLTRNARYLLDFWTSGEHYAALFPDPSVFRLDIGANDSVFLTTPSVNSVFSANSVRYFVEFTADDTSETIAFTNFGHVTSGGSIPTATELVLDDVILNRMPEPATVALVAIGLLGLVARHGRVAAAPGASATRRRTSRNGWLCMACAVSAFMATRASAFPIVLPGGPLHFQFRTAEQYSPGNDINNSANPAGVGSQPEGNWGIVQIMTISTGTLVSPTGFDIAGPGATVFSDGQNNGQQILGIFYAVLNNPGTSPSTSTGGVLDLYFWDKSSQMIDAPLDPNDLGQRGNGGSQSGNSAASRPSQYQGFTCLPNNMVGCTFLARFNFTPGADVRTGFNTNTIFTAANATVSETYMAVDTATPGAWSDALDSDFFTFDPIKQPCGPAVACKRANDARLDAPFILAPDWDIVGSDIVGLAKEGSLRVFSTPEPATLALLVMGGLAAAGAIRSRRRRRAARPA